MKEKMLRRGMQFFSLALAVLLFANASVLEVSAAEMGAVENEVIEELEASIISVPDDNQKLNPNARTFLVNCSINIYSSSAGMLVECFTDSVGTASVIGVKDIKIQQKVWYGWKTVATSSGAESKNTDAFGCSILYSGAVKGETYRVSCVHYGTVDSYTEVENETPGIVHTY